MLMFLHNLHPKCQPIAPRHLEIHRNHQGRQTVAKQSEAVSQRCAATHYPWVFSNPGAPLEDHIQRSGQTLVWQLQKGDRSCGVVGARRVGQGRAGTWIQTRATACTMHPPALGSGTCLHCGLMMQMAVCNNRLCNTAIHPSHYARQIPIDRHLKPMTDTHRIPQPAPVACVIRSPTTFHHG